MSKQLIFIRDADSNRFSEKLTDDVGTEQVRQTATTLEKFLQNKNFIIFHSEKTHSVEAAELFNQYYNNKATTQYSYGLTAPEMPLVDRMLYRKIRELSDNKIDCVVLWGDEVVLNNQIDMFALNGLNENPQQASGYIVETEDWADITINAADYSPMKPVANFVSGKPVQRIESLKKQPQTMKPSA